MCGIFNTGLATLNCTWNVCMTCFGMHGAQLLMCTVHASQSTTRVKPFICTMPMRLDDGWNQIQFNLSDFTRRAYGERVFAAHNPTHTDCTTEAECIWLLCNIDHGGHCVNRTTNLAKHIVLQAPTTLRHCGCKCTPTAASGASISQTACTQRRSCPLRWVCYPHTVHIDQ